MDYSKNVRDQLKNITKQELMRALRKDGWEKDMGPGSIFIFRHPDGRRASVHDHPHETFGKTLLKNVLNDIDWSVEDLKKLKLIK